MAINWDALLNIRANVSGKRDIQDLGRSLQGVEGQYKRLGRTVKNLAVTYLGLRTAQASLQAGIERTESVRRLTLLSRGYGELAEAQEAAAKAAKTFGLSTTQANKQFAQIYARLRPVGIGLEDIQTVFDGFNTAAKLSGTTTAEAAGSFLQLSQALGSGILRGQEFNAIFEQTPMIIQAIARRMNVATGQVRDLAKQGRITSDIVIAALGDIKRDGADQLEEALQGPNQAIVEFRNTIEDLQVVLVEDFLPELNPLLKETAGFLKTIAPLLKAFTALPIAGFGGLNKLRRQMNEPDPEQRIRDNIRAGQLPGAGTKFGFGFDTGYGKPGSPLANVFENFSSEYGVGFEAIMEEAKVLKDYKAGIEDIHVFLDSVLLELMVKYLPVTEEIDANIKKIHESMKEVKNETKEVTKEAKNFGSSISDGMKEYANSIKDTAGDIKKATVSAFKGMEDAMVQFVMTGKLDFRSLATSILADMARIAIRAMIIKPIMAGLGLGFATGGVIDSGGHVTKYAKGGVVNSPHYFAMGGSGNFGVLGEAGPEAILPLKRHASGNLGVEGGGNTTNVVVNVDASGSEVQGDQEEGKMLGQLIAAAVKGTIINEQRPGGLLAPA